MTGCDAVLFVTSAYSISAKALARLEAAAAGATPLPSRLIRLERSGPSLIDALDALRAEGHRDIRVQPFGLPFPEGLHVWLPGVMADWRARGENADTRLSLGPDPATHAEGLAAFADAALTNEAPAKDVAEVPPKLGKPGWNDPPDFDFHLLVCTGPRCHVHGAVDLLELVKEECAAAGISGRCLTTRTGCIFPCNRGPILALYPHGTWYRLPDRAAVRAFVGEVLVAGGDLPERRFHTARLARARQDHDD
ncbi:(2Fe-2S) ferredoxin domain-containing protein [Pseudoroseicyclus sp. CXY001]|uniref:(2Fe-2S) ferredoxin domain-containing protein n=1 Tax=Pseudoroseicyclus sp. CXY001 TaxID=3242492 RepID=UPI0035709C02